MSAEVLSLLIVYNVGIQKKTYTHTHRKLLGKLSFRFDNLSTYKYKYVYTNTKRLYKVRQQLHTEITSSWKLKTVELLHKCISYTWEMRTRE